MKITTFRLLSWVATASSASKSGVSASNDNMLARLPVGDPKTKDPLVMAVITMTSLIMTILTTINIINIATVIVTTITTIISNTTNTTAIIAFVIVTI